MSARFFVTLPTRIERGWSHLPPHEERAQAVRAAEVAGLDGVVAGYDLDGEESSVIIGDALRHTRWLAGVLEFQVANLNPVYAAKLASSAQRFHGGRLVWAPLVEATALSQRRPASTTATQWFARAEEFLTVARGVWHDPDFAYAGEYYQVQGGFHHPLAGLPFPQVRLVGTTEEALTLSARHGDVHLFASPGERDAFGPELDELARAAGRRVRHGVRLAVLAREDAAEAFASLPDGQGPASSADPALWRDGFVKNGYATSGGYVGGYVGVAAELDRLAAAGVEAFELDVRPRIEETYRLGEHLLPLVRARSAAGTGGVPGSQGDATASQRTAQTQSPHHVETPETAGAR